MKSEVGGEDGKGAWRKERGWSTGESKRNHCSSWWECQGECGERGDGNASEVTLQILDIVGKLRRILS